mmetsp:Transcript_18243/g.51142  ORF Transcript_18243/g.51142 Transcript_18243/m.51142 type:complete len:200 (-) Transcript_18243:1270-1869(-)
MSNTGRPGWPVGTPPKPGITCPVSASVEKNIGDTRRLRLATLSTPPSSMAKSTSLGVGNSTGSGFPKLAPPWGTLAGASGTVLLLLSLLALPFIPLLPAAAAAAAATRVVLFVLPFWWGAPPFVSAICEAGASVFSLATSLSLTLAAATVLLPFLEGMPLVSGPPLLLLAPFPLLPPLPRLLPLLSLVWNLDDSTRLGV